MLVSKRVAIIVGLGLLVIVGLGLLVIVGLGLLVIVGHLTHIFHIPSHPSLKTLGSLRLLLQGRDGERLEAQLRLEILCDLTYEALEGQLVGESFGRLLVATDLTEGDGARPVAVTLLIIFGLALLIIAVVHLVCQLQELLCMARHLVRIGTRGKCVAPLDGNFNSG